MALGFINGLGSPLYPTPYYTGSFIIRFISVKRSILMAIPLNILFIFFIASLGILVSTIIQNSTASICASIILAVAVNIFNIQLRLFKNISWLIPFSYSNNVDILNGNMITLFNNRNLTCLTGILILAVFTVMFYFIACLVFSRKDITC